MAQQILIRRGLEASILSTICPAGELLYATDTKKVYIGTGSGNVLVGGGVNSSQVIIVNALPAIATADPNAVYLLETGPTFYKADTTSGVWKQIGGGIAVLNRSAFPVTGDVNTLYFALDENLFYQYTTAGGYAVTHNDYIELKNKPVINGITLQGAQTTQSLNLDQVYVLSRSFFPATGKGTALYVASDEQKIYRFDTATAQYVALSGGASNGSVQFCTSATLPTTGVANVLYVTTDTQEVLIWVSGTYMKLNGSAGVGNVQFCTSLPSTGQFNTVYVDLGSYKSYVWAGSNFVRIDQEGTSGTSLSSNVRTYPTLSDFPTAGESGVIYVDNSTGKQYMYGATAGTGIYKFVAACAPGLAPPLAWNAARMYATRAEFPTAGIEDTLYCCAADGCTISHSGVPGTTNTRYFNGLAFYRWMNGNYVLLTISTHTRSDSSDCSVLSGVSAISGASLTTVYLYNGNFAGVAANVSNWGGYPAFLYVGASGYYEIAGTSTVNSVGVYANATQFPTSGATGIYYIALDTGLTYHWTGTTYEQYAGSGASSTFYTKAEVDNLLSSCRNIQQVTTLPAAPTPLTLYYVGTTTPYDIYLCDTTGNLINLGTSEASMSQYQRINEPTLTTANKTIPGAINELNSKVNLTEIKYVSALPTTGESGILYICTTDHSAQYWDGVQYQLISGAGGTSTNIQFVTVLPDTGETGVIYVNSVNCKTYIWNGTEYVRLDNEVGSIIGGGTAAMVGNIVVVASEANLPDVGQVGVIYMSEATGKLYKYNSTGTAVGMYRYIKFMNYGTTAPRTGTTASWIKEADTFTMLPAVGSIDFLYHTTSDNQYYRWTGAQYINMTIYPFHEWTDNGTVSNAGTCIAKWARDLNTLGGSNTGSVLGRNDLVFDREIRCSGVCNYHIWYIYVPNMNLSGVTGTYVEITGTINGSVLLYNDRASFPTTGQTGNVYFAYDTGARYYWSGTDYIQYPNSGGGGTSDYTALNNKPQINGIELVGNKSQADLHIEDNVVFGLYGSFPATGSSKVLYIDPMNNAMYRWDGSQYVEFIDNSVVYVTTLPSSGDIKKLYICEGDGKLYYWNGTAFKVIGGSSAAELVFGPSLPASGDSTKLYIETTNMTINYWNGTMFKALGSANVAFLDVMPGSGVDGKLYVNRSDNTIYRWNTSTNAFVAIGGGGSSNYIIDVAANFPATGDVGKMYYATDRFIAYAWSGGKYVPVANFSQPSVVFDTETSYNAWLAALPSWDSEANYVVYQNWVVDSPVQCYLNFAAFPATGLKHTLYIACDTLKLYLWQYQTEQYIQVTN